MTNLPTSRQLESPISVAAKAAKEKRRAVLERVRAQRAKSYKKSLAQCMQDGTVIRASELKNRYMAT